MKTKEQTIAEIDASLIRSRARQKAYEAKGDERSAEIEADVQDRLLRERLEASR